MAAKSSVRTLSLPCEGISAASGLIGSRREYEITDVTPTPRISEPSQRRREDELAFKLRRSLETSCVEVGRRAEFASRQAAMALAQGASRDCAN